MPISAFVLIAAVLHLAVFVSYPQSGRFGFPFLYISVILWSSFAIFINRSVTRAGAFWKAALAVGFTLMCAFSALSFLPQKDGISALHKFTWGEYPDRKTLYFGLLRLGVDAPRLLTPEKEEPLP